MGLKFNFNKVSFVLFKISSQQKLQYMFRTLAKGRTCYQVNIFSNLA